MRNKVEVGREKIRNKVEVGRINKGNA